jgi:hypothetical protein
MNSKKYTPGLAGYKTSGLPMDSIFGLGGFDQSFWEGNFRILDLD